MGKSQFIQEIEAYAQQMAERLPQTKEGGIIIMAVDEADIAKCIIARPADRKMMVAELLKDEDVKQSLMEIFND